MKKTNLAMACALCAVSAWAAWNPGEPVVTYWFGPGCPGNAEKTTPLTDTWAKQLKEGGFNTVWASSPEELDIAAKHGKNVLLDFRPEFGELVFWVALTLGLTQGAYDEIVQVIAECRKKVIAIATRDSATDEVYRLNMQFFPLTQKSSKKG